MWSLAVSLQTSCKDAILFLGWVEMKKRERKKKTEWQADSPTGEKCWQAETFFPFQNCNPRALTDSCLTSHYQSRNMFVCHCHVLRVSLLPFDCRVTSGFILKPCVLVRQPACSSLVCFPSRVIRLPALIMFTCSPLPSVYIVRVSCQFVFVCLK